MDKKIIGILNTINKNSDLETISGYNYMVNHWNQYDIADSKKDFIEILNMLQANGETLESLNDCYQNGGRNFMSIFGDVFESRREIAEAVKQFNVFYTPLDFIAYLLSEREEIGSTYDDYNDYINYFQDVAAGNNGDHQIYKTKDGYVRRIWY